MKFRSWVTCVMIENPVCYLPLLWQEVLEYHANSYLLCNIMMTSQTHDLNAPVN